MCEQDFKCAPDTITAAMVREWTFSVKICVKWDDNKCGETFIKKDLQKIVVVVSGGLRSYFYSC